MYSVCIFCVFRYWKTKKKKKSSINFEKISDLFVQAMNYNLQITEEKEKKKLLIVNLKKYRNRNLRIVLARIKILKRNISAYLFLSHYFHSVPPLSFRHTSLSLFSVIDLSSVFHFVLSPFSFFPNFLNRVLSSFL